MSSQNGYASPKNPMYVAPGDPRKPWKPNTILHVDPRSTYENPRNPRRDYKESETEELGSSIIEIGQSQPIPVYPDGRLKGGHRRRRALGRHNTKIRVEVRPFPKDETTELLEIICDNHGQKPLSVADRARVVKDLYARGVSNHKIATAFSMSLSWVTNTLVLIDLDDRVLSMIDAEDEGRRLFEATAREIAHATKDRSEQYALATVIARKRMTLPQAKEYIRKQLGSSDLRGQAIKPSDRKRMIEAFAAHTEAKARLILTTFGRKRTAIAGLSIEEVRTVKRQLQAGMLYIQRLNTRLDHEIMMMSTGR